MNQTTELTANLRSRRFAADLFPKISTILLVAFLLTLAPDAPAQDRVTKRFGEGATCDVTGVTRDALIDELYGSSGGTSSIHYYRDPFRHVVMRFDLSSIPPGATIHKATLRLFNDYDYFDGGDGGVLQPLHALTDPSGTGLWSEDGIDYTHKRAGVAWSAGGNLATVKGAVIGSIYFKNWYSSPQAWWEADLTEATQTWVNDSASNFGFLLPGHANFNKRVAAREYADATRRPYLEITYAAANDQSGAWFPAAPTPGAVNPAPLICPAGCPQGVAPEPPDENDVTITEVFANPAGYPDRTFEWLEFCVADSAACVTLEGVVVAKAAERTVGEEMKGHVFSATTGNIAFAGGRCYVIGGVDAATTPPAAPGLPRTVGGAQLHQIVSGLDLVGSSDDAAVGFWVQGRADPIAVARYGQVSDDVARQRILGTAGESWCDSAYPYDDIRRGSPGLANPDCDACFCRDASGATVAAVQPAAGELAITELLSDVPGADTGANTLREWFEVRMTPRDGGARELGCLHVGKSAADRAPLVREGFACQPVADGAWLLFGRSRDEDENGGLSPAPDFLYSSSAKLNLTAVGRPWGLFRSDGTPVDVLPAPGEDEETPEFPEGFAQQLDLDVARDGAAADANDAVTAWCAAIRPYGPDADAARGTPGAENFRCDACYCRDKGDDDWPEVPSPGPAEMRITEVFANVPGSPPDGMSEFEQEWVELRARHGSGLRYLNCVELRFHDGKRRRPFGHDDPTCLPVADGELVLLVGDQATAIDQGFWVTDPPGGRDRLAWTFVYDSNSGYGITTSASAAAPKSLTLVAGEDVIDTLTYARDIKDGFSLMLPGSLVDPGRPIDPGSYCDARADSVYFTDDGTYSKTPDARYHGTPGVANPACD